MSFLESISGLLSGTSHSLDEYIDLGNGLPWFIDYQSKGAPTLSEYFGLNKDRQIKIKATVDKTGFYQTSKGKRWVVIAHYLDKEKRKEFSFYVPEFQYDPIDDYGAGTSVDVYVDPDDYSKYEVPIY